MFKKFQCTLVFLFLLTLPQLASAASKLSSNTHVISWVMISILYNTEYLGNKTEELEKFSRYIPDQCWDILADEKISDVFQTDDLDQWHYNIETLELMTSIFIGNKLSHIQQAYIVSRLRDYQLEEFILKKLAI